VHRIVFRVALIASAIAAVTLSGALSTGGQLSEAPPAQPPETEESASGSRDAEITRARDTLADLLASEQIERIDFEAETYDQAMDHIHAAVDTILELNLADSRDIPVLVENASEVIGALNSHKPRGLMMTFGKDVDRLPVRSPGEARMLGELVGKTVLLIRERFGEQGVSYGDEATKLFRSAVLDVEEGSFLVQYLEAIRHIADQPAGKRARYFR
jgi:hypothetical protein